jgi:hypothetical protein
MPRRATAALCSPCPCGIAVFKRRASAHFCEHIALGGFERRNLGIGFHVIGALCTHPDLLPM